MSQIKVTPQKQREFADNLEKRTQALLKKRLRFLEAVAKASILCKDAKYSSFKKSIEEATQSLDTFNRKSKTFVDYLRRKAAAGEKYLKR